MSLTIDPWSFPAAELDPKGEGEKSIVLGGGCFWCVEAVFKELDGVTNVRPGYAGGTAATADYKTVCTGRTDHAEVVEVVYDAGRIGLGEILKVFFAIAHDPTEVNRQGNDVGRQYRSAIFYADDMQREVAELYMDQIERAGVFPRHRACAAGGVLRRRGLSPRLRGAEPGSALYPRRGPAQDRDDSGV